MFRSMTAALALGVGILAAFFADSSWACANEPAGITAIDILLVPDATMMKQAEAANERLRKNFPRGFELDATHRPHVTCVQRFVRTADLDQVYAAIDKLLAREKPASWKLKAFKYYYIPTGDNGLAGIVAEPTDELIQFQQTLIDALAPFTVKVSDKSAFATTKEEPDIDPALIAYVRDFVPKSSGKNYNPHVTIGLAQRVYLDALLKEKFEAFTFSPAGVAVYQLGNFGTARKQLKAWELKP